ncbi:hypothetical protein SGLAD_v1c05910 [Spiroplasma gladiatoris]|uniref:Uncharacterized protein n=1 Tax=Spiroplasma gladiatoris TaxID=2143 RepID=A0A4P7AJS0_9MOLU|nr:hypothetical protein [Spiroplasma gladiatoris]QBQ07790.1 hypothetical protein SGLAD_v1c05910 [Spiroplasma gladiatoris]
MRNIIKKGLDPNKITNNYSFLISHQLEFAYLNSIYQCYKLLFAKSNDIFDINFKNRTYLKRIRSLVDYTSEQQNNNLNNIRTNLLVNKCLSNTYFYVLHLNFYIH